VAAAAAAAAAAGEEQRLCNVKVCIAVTAVGSRFRLTSLQVYKSYASCLLGATL
jgi:hypothetical protein